MNPLYTQILVGILRHLVGLVGAAGALSDSQLQQLAGAVFVIGSIGWSIYEKVRARNAKEGE